MQYQLPIYDISIEEALHLGVDEVAFVEDPAIQELFIAMADEQIKLSADNDMMIVTGPALVPDRLIYRVHPKTGMEYYIRFSKEVIQQIVKRYFTQNKQLNFNLEHNKENDVQGVILESWIVKDPTYDQSVLYGFKNLPIGTWMVAVKVEDQQFWNEYVKTGKVRGFSIEGAFGQSLAEAMSKQELVIDRKAGETQDEFVSRCIAFEVGNGYDVDQATAMCYAKWDEGVKLDLKEYTLTAEEAQILIEAILMSKYEYPVGDFLSGFSEDENNPCEYELACQDMVIRGVEYFDMHPELHELISKGGVGAFDEVVQPLIEFMCQGLGEGATGAMVEHTAKHAYYAYKLGWDEYIKEMSSYHLSSHQVELSIPSPFIASVELATESYNDYPQAASDAAKRALKYKEENPGNTCGTRVGWARANQLADRRPISEETIARMASFARHLQWEDVSYEDGCGSLMVDAWGGRSGIEWAKRKLEQIRRQNN